MAITRHVRTINLTGEIEVVTGLHIGAGSDTIEIGGMDNPIITDPVTGRPYIPGSSIKGKLRSLIEWRLVPDRILNSEPTELGNRKAGDPCNCGAPDCPSCVVFGVSAGDNLDLAEERGPTRIMVRDAVLTSRWSQRYRAGHQVVEAKHENSINRITARANPRPIERVVPGVRFSLDISYRVFACDADGEEEGAEDTRRFESVVLTGLALLEADYLGGGGSRGNGRIRFHDLQADGRPVSVPEV